MPSKSFREIIEDLPPVLRDTIYSDSTYTTIKDAVNLAGLSQDKSAILSDIVINILSGITPLNKFNEELRKKLNIPNANLEIVSKVIQQKIFSPIKRNLMLLPVNEHPLINIPEKEKLTPRPDITKLRHPSPTKVTPQVKPLVRKVSPSPKEASPLAKVKHQNIPSNIPSSLSFQKKVAPPVKRVKELEKKTSIPFPTAVPHPVSIEKKQPLPHLPEPAEVSVKKAEIKTTRLKNFSVSPQYRKQAAEIKSKLLAAMEKRMAPPKIVKTMKQLSQKGWKKIKKLPPKKKNKSVKLDSTIPSQVFSGEKGKFLSKKKKNIPEKKPFIFAVNLKKEKREAEITKKEEPISYSKYKPKNPFGNA